MNELTNQTEETIQNNTEGEQDDSGVDQGAMDTGADRGTEEKGSGEEKSFMELYEESMKSPQEGDLVSGEIVQIDKDFVLVDIGYKSEGQIQINEFLDAEGNLDAKVGDQVDVLLERREDEDGVIILSKEKAAKIKVWDQIRDIYKSDGIIQGRIVSRIKGGMSVDIGLQAFLPGSQIDLKPVRDFDSLINTTHDFKILKYNRRRGNIVLSRRAILEEERAAQKKETLKILEEGAVLDGVVKNITDYGLFVDLGGIDGLLHITDMSWGRVGHPSEMYKIGDPIQVKVLNFDPQTEKVSLGLKQLKPDPWTEADQRYPVGTRIHGRVVSLADYGAFVEVEQGIEGLIHISEMSWTRKIRHPSQVVKVGDEVEAMVLNIDTENKRISLGLKQTEANPWEVIGEKYPVGTTIEGKIKNITDFGIFIGIDEGIDGLVHISDISWTRRVKHPSELYKKGQEVQAVVLNIDKANERFSLGIKQLATDPWDEVPEKYRPGTKITGRITNITDFGVFLELEEGIEGLIHVSELGKDKSGNPLGRFKVDDVIQAKVINVNRTEKKIGLSVRKLDETDEKEIYSNYMNSRREATSNLGELLREMQSQQASAAEDREPSEEPDEGLQEATEPAPAGEPDEDLQEAKEPSTSDESEEKPLGTEAQTPEEESSDSDTD
jgi:small subunit ribosomal protein S1